MDKAIGPLRDSRAPPWLRGTRSDVPAETTPLIGPGSGHNLRLNKALELVSE